MEVAQGHVFRRRGRPGRVRFNPCCHGSCSRAPGFCSCASRRKTFQSLLSWKLLKGLVGAVGPMTRREMFQSLLSWKLLKGDTRVTAGSFPHGVSILVVMEVAQGHVGRRVRNGARPVSILVVMEVAQGQQWAQPGLIFSQRFNPCCHGSCSRARPPDREPAARVEFQSLLSWKLLKGTAGPETHRRGPGVSILVVMEVAQGHRGRLAYHCPSDVSILVVMEVAQGRGKLAPKAARAERFQSLLSWKLLKGSQAAGPGDDPAFCFNPCCHGSCSRAYGVEDGVFELDQFQSLLSWKLLKGASPELSTRLQVMFQSLLSWKLLKGSLFAIGGNVM